MITKKKKLHQFQTMRSFVGFAFVVFALSSLSHALDLETAVQKYRNREAQITPQEVLSFLKEGNARFLKGKSEHGFYPTDARERIAVSAQGQRPIAAVLSCIDSRTSPELVFDTSVGDIFTARVGANVINEDVLGSLEIASDSGAKVIVVLGHTDCGGIKAACNNVEFGHFTQLLERIKPVVQFANSLLDADSDLSHVIGERVTTNRKYVAHVSHVNVMESTKQILEKSSIIKDKIVRGELILAPAIYDVDSGAVVF